ncbi:hypothetical protein T492DRAFT_895888 [Pavlovales sp. CCMP2436]|nr:hypothetical protein T492DRAFT_895888 [Pavlovales sp. CCMP2436]
MWFADGVDIRARVLSSSLAEREAEARQNAAAAARQMACDVVHSLDLVDHEADLRQTGDAHDALRRPSVLA